MPIYEYECKCGTEQEIFFSMAERKDHVDCPNCGGKAGQRISRRFQVNTFKPYVEDGFNGKPVEITSKAQRDELCKAHGVTYDSGRYVRKPKRKAAVDEITFDDVKRAIERGKLPDGTPLESPIPAGEAETLPGGDES